MTNIPAFDQQIQWIAGGSQGHHPTMYAGERYLVAVRVFDAHDRSKSWWEFDVITAEEDGFTLDGTGWGWSWEDVDWYVPVKFLCPPVLETKENRE